MTTLEKVLISKALDGLWGVCDAAHDICETMIDPKDGRILQMVEALCKAQDAITDLNESFGIEKH